MGADGETFSHTVRVYTDGRSRTAATLKNDRKAVEDVLEASNEPVLLEGYRSRQTYSNADAERWLLENIYRAGSPGQVRGALGEEILQRRLLKQADTGIDVADGSIYANYKTRFDSGPYDSGFDGIAETGSGRLLLIETKVKSHTGRLSPSSAGLKPDGNGDIQFGRQWNQKKLQSMANEARTQANNPDLGDEKLSFLEDLEANGYVRMSLKRNSEGDIDTIQIRPTDDVETRMIVAQDGPVQDGLASPEFRKPSGSAKDLSIDHLHQIKIGDVFTLSSP